MQDLTLGPLDPFKWAGEGATRVHSWRKSATVALSNGDCIGINRRSNCHGDLYSIHPPNRHSLPQVTQRLVAGGKAMVIKAPQKRTGLDQGVSLR